MRSLLALISLAMINSIACAQEQETKLVDRLLRPDMSLANSAQSKKFVASDGVLADKEFTAGTFNIREASKLKRFSGQWQFSARGFSAKTFSGGDTAANLWTRSAIPHAQTQYETVAATSLYKAHDSGRSVQVRDFQDTHPFLVQGKSQKALSQQDKPLTIEQVRELLNKNK